MNQSEIEIKTLNETINEQEINLDHLELQVEVSDEQIKELKGEKHKLQKRLCGLKSNSQRSKCSLVTQHETEISELKGKIDFFSKKNK